MSESPTSKRKALWLVIFLPVVLIPVLLVGCLSTVAGTQSQGPDSLPSAVGLNDKAVPAAYVPWLNKAGGVCPQMTAPMLASQVDAESSFTNPGPNAFEAEGPAQWTPAIWKTYGVDGDGNGTKDPRTIPDALMALAEYECKLWTKYSQQYPKADTWSLVLAAYNAGEPAVDAAGGAVPPYAETQNYVAKIKADLGKFTGGVGPSGPGQLGNGPCPLGSSPQGVTCNQAIAFEVQQMNSGSHSWHDGCLGLVTTAYGGTWGGIHDAATAARIVQADGLMHPITSAKDIPRGAVVWWVGGSEGNGHVAISDGGGEILSSDVPVLDGRVGVEPLDWFTQNWHSVQLFGWSAPRR